VAAKAVLENKIEAEKTIANTKVIIFLEKNCRDVLFIKKSIS